MQSCDKKLDDGISLETFLLQKMRSRFFKFPPDSEILHNYTQSNAVFTRKGYYPNAAEFFISDSKNTSIPGV